MSSPRILALALVACAAARGRRRHHPAAPDGERDDDDERAARRRRRRHRRSLDDDQTKWAAALEAFAYKPTTPPPPAFWASWPDGHRSGGVGNQLEQLLGRAQCSMREGSGNNRSMVLPDLRSDRAVPPRAYRFEDVFDVGALRGVADVATWRDFLRACDRASLVRERGGDVPNATCGDDAAFARTALHRHARALEPPKATEVCDVGADAPFTDVLRNLPRCAVGVDAGAFQLLGPCARDVAPGRRAFKSGRPCAGVDVTQSPCATGFDWSATLSKAALGLVAPARAAAHLAPCDATAISRLDATEARAGRFLRALGAAPALLPVARRLRTSLFGAEPYDAVHVRLGDFGDLCGAAADPADRKYKFCPPADDELRRVFGELEKYGETAAPVLLLSDEPVEAARRLGGDARLRIPANASLVDAPRLAVEMHLAAHRAGKESEIPNFKGTYLGRVPLVSADSWTSDHLSERSRSVNAFTGTRARGRLTLKRR